MAIEIMLSGENVLLTGQAGAGKTYALNEFIRLAKKSGKVISVTATTGLAATHLGGTTIHAWSGMGVHDELPKNFFKDIAKGRRDIINKADVLVIDEISMLHDFRLDMVEEIARRVRGKEEPFGGLQVILCGDFFQLPPVNRNDSKTGGFIVNSEAWQKLNPTICYLSEQYRQNDDNFLEILNAMRANDIRRRHAEALLTRVGAELSDQEITELHTTNIDVDYLNERALQNLNGDVCTYTMQTTGKENYVESLKRSCLAAENLVLKKNALVMCIKNSPDKKYVNGSIGTVIGFDENTHYPIVELRNGRTLTIQPETWELRDGDKKRASIVQIPLRLAWAITIHKSQGMTLDAARIDLRKAFVEGMGYVALSRVKSLDSLSLLGINRMALSVSPSALEIDKSLKERSAVASEKFKYLEKKAEKRKKEPKPKKSEAKTPWAEKLEIMRQTYPNAFRPWKENDDNKLKELFEKGTKIKELCAEFGRHPGSIRSRLKKHFGEDIKFS